MSDSEQVSLSRTATGEWFLLVDGQDMSWAVRSVKIEVGGGDRQAKVWLELGREQVEFNGPADVVREPSDG